MTAPEFGPLDAALRAAAIRDDRDQEALLEQAIGQLTVPPRHGDATTLQIALWYANRGLPVFPIKPGEKRPLDRSRGLHDATTDPTRLTHWFEGQGGMFNVAIATGGKFDVIDLDGPDGYQAFIDMVTAAGTADWLHIRGITQTPRGMHLWVPATGGGNLAYKSGLDYRGKGGYVIVPPSHIDGTVYRWLLPPML